MAKKKNDRNEKENKNKGEMPDTLSNQNLGHNAKKEGLGPNTKR